MSASALRLVPFLTASMVVHAIVFMAAGPESLTFNTAPADKGHEVSIRLEAAAPAGAAADSAQSSNEIPEEESTSQPAPPEPETEPVDVAQLEAPPEPTDETAVEPDRKQQDEPVTSVEPESASEHAQHSEPVENPVIDDPEPQPAERIAEIDDVATGDASTSSEAQTAEAREAIVAELAKHFSYPRLAQQRGWEGTVVLTVRILPDGRLDGIRVKRSSGRTLLDRSARRSLASVERLPEFAERVGKNGLALEIPVTYRLESA